MQHTRSDYDTAIQALTAAIRRHYSASRWQAGQLLDNPALRDEIAAIEHVMNWEHASERGLGHLLTKLAANGAPLTKERRSGQSFWRLLPEVLRVSAVARELAR